MTPMTASFHGGPLNGTMDVATVSGDEYHVRIWPDMEEVHVYRLRQKDPDAHPGSPRHFDYVDTTEEP